MKRDILGLVLAGGDSRRFGEDKAVFSFHEGISQLDYALAVLSKFCLHLGVSLRKSQQNRRATPHEVTYVADPEGMSGPIAGVIAGLRQHPGRPTLALACDMPLVDAALVLKLLSQRNAGAQATCFDAADGRPEPLCALYEPSALPDLERAYQEGRQSLRSFLEEGSVERLKCEPPDLLASANTAEDLATIRKRLSQ